VEENGPMAHFQVNNDKGRFFSSLPAWPLFVFPPLHINLAAHHFILHISSFTFLYPLHFLFILAFFSSVSFLHCLSPAGTSKGRKLIPNNTCPLGRLHFPQAIPSFRKILTQYVLLHQQMAQAENSMKQHQFESQANTAICITKINMSKHYTNRSLNLPRTIDHDGYNKVS
jgi:hypothetical protein